MNGVLRVGVPESLRGARRGGHGRAWANVLECLEAMAGVELCFRSAEREAAEPRVDVWLADGHAPTSGAGRPVVVQVFEVGWRDPPQTRLLSPDFIKHIEQFTSAAVRSADRVVVPSQAARRDVIEAYGVPPETVHAVPLGVHAERFRGDATRGRQIVADAFASSPVPYVLFVGLLHPRKNLAVLREAMSRLAQKGLPHRLVVVGTPTLAALEPKKLLAEATAELPNEPGRVARIVKPSDPELGDLMAGADALCLPSHYEGFGLPALEAMASGTPVVVSDRGALPEVVGDAGVVVAPTAEEVEDALGRLLTDARLAGELAVKGRRRAAEFTWERTARGWRAALAEAADPGDARTYTAAPMSGRRCP